MTKFAFLFIPQRKEYPWQAVESGMVMGGSRVRIWNRWDEELALQDPTSPILTWNSYGSRAKWAHRHVRLGGSRRQYLMENGYVARDNNGEPYYLLEENGYQGFGRNRHEKEEPSRWEKLGYPILPWRKDGRKILVCGQRGVGYNEMAMPDAWPSDVCRRLKSLTDRVVAFRPHPGRPHANLPENVEILPWDIPLCKMLDEIHAVVVYTSNAAITAMMLGIPAIYEGPNHRFAKLMGHGAETIEHLIYGEREPHFWRMAWSQWNWKEIHDGIAWRATEIRD